MTKSTIANEISSASHTQADAETVNALVTLGGLIETQLVYQQLLEQKIFCGPCLADDKDAAKFQKKLMAQSSVNVLLLVWKDSQSVTVTNLNQAGMERLGSQCSPINIHSLATSLSTSVSEFEKQQKWIRSVVEAAEAYGLIQREPHEKSRRRILCGTEKLHAFMLALHAEIAAMYLRLATLAGGL